MRPAGSIRAALREHRDRLKAGESVTWHDLALALAAARLIDMGAPSEVRLVQKTIKNMVSGGELPVVGEANRPWSRKPLKLYGARAASQPGGVGDAARALEAALFGRAA